MSCSACNGSGWLPPIDPESHGGHLCPECNSQPPLVAGGQGHTAPDASRAAFIVFVCLVGMVLAFIAGVIGW